MYPDIARSNPHNCKIRGSTSAKARIQSLQYCLHTKLYSDIENDTSCNLNKVEKVLKDLGLKRTSYFDRIVTKSICKSITKRSAQILAGLIATVFKNFNSPIFKQKFTMLIIGNCKDIIQSNNFVLRK